MSSRLPTSALSRSASSLIVSQKLLTASGDHVISWERRLVAAALIDASGVRRSWETAASRRGAQLVGLGELLRGRRLGPQPGLLADQAQLGDEDAEQPPVVGRQLGAGQHQDGAPAEGGGEGRLFGAGGHRRPRSGLDHPFRPPAATAGAGFARRSRHRGPAVASRGKDGNGARARRWPGDRPATTATPRSPMPWRRPPAGRGPPIRSWPAPFPAAGEPAGRPAC